MSDPGPGHNLPPNVSVVLKAETAAALLGQTDAALTMMLGFLGDVRLSRENAEQLVARIEVQKELRAALMEAGVKNESDGQ
jgi:hypothetical protein